MTVRQTQLRRGQPHRPRFLWRGTLIVLPVVALAVFGALSLRQDRKLMDAEVRERAQQFAKDAAERCWGQLLSVAMPDLVNPLGAGPDDQESGYFQISTNGALIWPPDYSPLPTPNPTDFGRLSAEQSALWQRAEMGPITHAPSSQVADLRAFLATRPPGDWAARAHWRLGLLLRRSDPAQAIDQFRTLVAQFPDATGEIGLPLAPLAAVQLASLSLPASPPRNLAPDEAKTRILLNDLCSNSVARPSTLTPLLLAQSSNWERRYLNSTELTAKWTHVWDAQERRRAAYRAARKTVLPDDADSEYSPGSRRSPGLASPRRSWPPLFWFSHWEVPLLNSTRGFLPAGASTNWLAIRHPTGTNESVLFTYLSPRQFPRLLNSFGPAEATLPPYLGVSYRIGGRIFGGVRSGQRLYALLQSRRRPPALRPELKLKDGIFAAASHNAEDGAPLLTVSVTLEDPMALYARQRQRVLWFGALIAVSAVVAVIGLISAWSAFQRQERLYEQQSNFVSSVTHELRAPIGAVRLMAENLQRGKVSEAAEQRQFYDYIVQECCRLSAMIENVLNLARIEQGRQEYEFEPTDVVRLVESTVKLMGPNAAEAKVALKLELDQPSGGKESFRLDSRALQQALINLIDNAIKHSPAGSTVTIGVTANPPIHPSTDPSLHHSTTPSPHPPGPPRRVQSTNPLIHQSIDPRAHQSTNPPLHSGWLRLWVADHGPGIPAAEHQKIFERFYRLGSELRRETPGVGIGLSIVKHIVEAHHGTVRVESEPGQGSRFILELPAQTYETKQTDRG